MHVNITARKSYKTDKKKAIRKGFIITDEKYLSKFEKDGCTALVALLTENNHLYVANAGTTFNQLINKDMYLIEESR